jgi:hypothetical protein
MGHPHSPHQRNLKWDIYSKKSPEVAGLSGITERHMELGGIFIKEPTGNILFGAPKIVVTRFVFTASLPTARERTQLDRGLTIHAQPLHPWRVLARLVFF